MAQNIILLTSTISITNLTRPLLRLLSLFFFFPKNQHYCPDMALRLITDREDRHLLTDTDHDIVKSISSRWLAEGFWAIAELDGSAPDRLSSEEIEQHDRLTLL